MTFSAVRVAMGQGLRVPALVGFGFLAQHEEVLNGQGGTSSAGVNTRTINTEVVNTITGAFLGTNQFTLPVGTYEIVATGPSLISRRNRMFLYNVTDASVELIGASLYSALGATVGASAGHLQGRFTVSGSAKIFEVRHEVEQGETTRGFGIFVGDGVNKEIYTQVYIRDTAETEVQDLLHVRDEQTANTSGGTPSAGANTRVLNTVVTNEISGASLSSNQITLDSGTYEIDAAAPCYRGAEHRAYLYNTSDAAIEVLGANNFARENSGNNAHGNRSVVRGRFTIGSTKTFELRHEITSTNGGTQGLGVEQNDGKIEVYTDVFIREIVDDFDLLHIRDEKTANTDGGASLANDFQTRVLNTVIGVNEISGSSLASDTITLPAGTYEIQCTSPSVETTKTKVYLYNKDDAEYTIIGQNQYSRGVLIQANYAYLYGQFRIEVETDFEIRLWTNEAEATNGLGKKMNDGELEVYTEVMIRKLI